MLYIAPFVAAVLQGDDVNALRAKMMCSNVDVNYVPFLWRSLNDARVISEDPTPIVISISGKEFAELLFAADGGVLEGIVRNKIRPAFIKKGWICIACQTKQASSMINTIAFRPQAPEGPTIVDATPFAVCDSTTCIHRATRRAKSLVSDAADLCKRGQCSEGDACCASRSS